MHDNAHDAHHDVDFLRDGKGLKSWLFTLDHKRIGVMYLIGVLIAFALGGTFALLLRTELLTPGETIVGADTYNRFFTLHGAVMVFVFIIPSVPAALGNFALPLQLGAKDVAFPRLNLLSFWIWMIGTVLALLAIVMGGIDTGWTFYTPYSSSVGGAVTMMTFAAFVLGFSSILTGLNFIVTVHKMRAPGMTFFRMPLFVWAIYATAILQVMATPVLGITLLLLIAERVLGIGIFDPALGGDPVLFQHFFWFYSHPAVYIMILPGMAVINETITAFSRRNIFGYRAIAYSSLGIAIISFLVWGHHMFVSGQSAYAGMVFSFLTYLVAIPTAIKVINWVTTLYKGSISFDTPMIWTLSFLILFTIGGLTGIFLASMGTDVHLHDTYFVVAHFHYVMMGGTAIGFFGGIHYWWPKMTGRMYKEGPGRLSAAMVFVGFNLTFFTQFILGTRGMPRRYYNYVPEFQTLHQISTAGAYILGLSFLIMAINLLMSLKNGAKAPANPWGARTLEWTHCSSPPITHNFHETPVVTEGPYEFPAEGQTTGTPAQKPAH